MAKNSIIGKFFGTGNNNSQPEQSNIKMALASIREANGHIGAYARERSLKQMSVGALAGITKDLQEIERRLAMYDKN